MRARVCVVAVLLATVFAPIAITTSGDRLDPRRQWAIAYLPQPTFIASVIVEGPVIFTHDDARMARGEPCTSIYRFDPRRGPTEELVAFHCIPVPRGIVGRFKMTTRPNLDTGVGCILTEYQFAGDAEGHRVPMPANAH
jgi:hypothetical protein